MPWRTPSRRGAGARRRITCASGPPPARPARRPTRSPCSPARRSGPGPPVTILATDISEAALARARQALYSGRSPASLPPGLRDRYLEPVRAASPPSKPCARWSPSAATTSSRSRRPALFDVVVCRNVMIYFDADTVELATTHLERALVPGGTLVLGAADRLPAAARALMRKSPPPSPRRRAGATPRRAAARHRAGGGPARAAPAPEEALRAADRGDLTEAIALAARAIAADPHDARAHFVRGIAELGADDPAAAIVSLRRALYIDPAFGLAAFQLARAYDVAGDERAAVRALRPGARHARSRRRALRPAAGQARPGRPRRRLPCAAARRRRARQPLRKRRTAAAFSSSVAPTPPPTCSPPSTRGFGSPPISIAPNRPSSDGAAHVGLDRLRRLPGDPRQPEERGGGEQPRLDGREHVLLALGPVEVVLLRVAARSCACARGSSAALPSRWCSPGLSRSEVPPFFLPPLMSECTQLVLAR